MTEVMAMAKCVRCGRGGMGLVHQALKLKDKNMICFKCYKELGGEPWKDMTTASITYSYEDIKDGFEAMENRKMAKLVLETNLSEANQFGITLKLVNQLNKAGATDPEKRLLGAICAVLADEGRDIDVIDAAPGNAGSLLLMIDGTVFIEYKSDEGVKWIRFDNEGQEKVRISGPARINALASRVVAAYDSVTA